MILTRRLFPLRFCEFCLRGWRSVLVVVSLSYTLRCSRNSSMRLRTRGFRRMSCVFLQNTIGRKLQLLDEERLRQIVQLMRLEKLERVRPQSIPGNEKNAMARRVLRANESVIESRPVHARHAQIADDQIVIRAHCAEERFLAIQHRLDA